MSSKPGDHVRLGLFVLAGTAVLVVALYLLGSKQDLFRSTITVGTSFREVGGLRPGNNVRFAGITVGTVKEIIIVSDTVVRVEMAIREDDAVHISSNAIASLGSDGLMGNKLVNINPGEGEAAVVTDGAMLASSKPLDTEKMMRTLDRTNLNMADITDDLREMSERINQPGGIVRVLTDTVLAGQVRSSLTDLQVAVAHVRSATANVDAMLAEVNAGKGMLGMLVSDTAAEMRMRRLLGTMEQMSDTLAHATAEVDRFTKGLNAPGGTAYTLTRDTAVAGDVRRTVQQLEKSSYTLEENLRALQRNWFFRKYFKEKEKAKKEAGGTPP